MSSMDATSEFVREKIITNILNHNGVFTSEDENDPGCDPPIAALYIYDGIGESLNFKLIYNNETEVLLPSPYVRNPKLLWVDGKFTDFGLEWCSEHLPNVKLPERNTNGQ